MADGREEERATFQFIEEIENLTCVVVWHEFDVWTHEFANFFKFANTSWQA